MKCIIPLFALVVMACNTPSQNADSNLISTVESITDPLPSWNEGANKEAIIQYVKTVTDKNSKDYIAPSDLIATFDNDGTLWSEQPLYFQLFFAIDRITELAPEHPEWESEEPFSSVLKGDLNGALAGGEESIIKLVMVSHSGVTSTEFNSIVTNWIDTAKHPISGKSYTQLVYQPMLELLDYLRAHDFKTFIVSGGGIDFMRPWSEAVYGIPSEQVVGSGVEFEFEMTDSGPVLNRLPKMNFIDDKAGKPVGIQRHIGKKPVFAAGNSDGDLQMLQWTDSNEHLSFQLYIHHTDSVRETAYDREGPIGKLDKGWDEAVEKEWTVADMAKDWNTVWPE